MRRFGQKMNEPVLQIDEDEVNRFYQERQVLKKQMFNSSGRQSFNNDGQNAHKSLFRRKSLMSRLKDDLTIFQSFDTSLQGEQSVTNRIGNDVSVSKFNRSFDSNNLPLNREESQLQKVPIHSENYDRISQCNDYPQSLKRSYQNIPKKRCSSMHLEKSSFSTRNQSQRSVQSFKPLKQTVPLSSILKKYQQEVNKIKNEGIKITDQKLFFKRSSEIQIIQTRSNQKNKQNVNTLQNTLRRNYDSSFLIDNQSRQESEEIKLPQVVEKCIDKWKKLQIQQMMAQKQSQIEKKNNLQKQTRPDQIEQNRNQMLKNCQKQINNDIEKMRVQYQQKLRQQEQKIRLLQKENNQYRKFAVSIQKMKLVLEKVQNEQQNIHHHINDSQTINPNDDHLQHQQQSINLKELWRWIKSLPKTTQHDKKQSKLLR